MGEQLEKPIQPIQGAVETDRGIGRREFMQGAAATGIVMVGSSYVKPALKLAGVTRLASTASAPPRIYGDDYRKRKPREDDDRKDEKKVGRDQ